MRAPISVFTGLALASITGITLLSLPKGDLLPESAGPGVATYRVDVSSSNLENGDFYTNAGTRLHFNEDGVIEGGYIEIAPLGGLYLTTPINGLANVAINLYDRNGYEDQFTFAWCSAPYEAMEIYDGGANADEGQGRHDFSTPNAFGLPPRYFCITNPSDSKYIRINYIVIYYECTQNFDEIVGEPLAPASSAYDNTDVAKTLEWNISSEAAHVDFFDRGYVEEYLQRFPGTYPVAYTVYSASSDHSFQYSKLSSYTVAGFQNGNHAVTFHGAFEHAYGWVEEASDGQDYHGAFPGGWIWDAPINDFKNITEDRHYYPVMNAFGFDPNGHCSTVVANWYLNEGHVEMPEPDHVDEGYYFVGWYKDSSLSIPYDPNQTYNSNLTLYAKVVKPQPLFPIRPIYYYSVDKHNLHRKLEKIDYVILNQVSGDTRYGDYRVHQLTEDAFYYNTGDDDGYCQTSSLLRIKEKAGPVVILDLYDPDVELNHDYHIEYRSETITGETFHTATHFSDRTGYREMFDPLANVDRQLPALPFHVKDGQTRKTIVATDGYIYPYARRNTYLDDLDALTEIGPYAYACYSASSAKPLYGLSGHNRVTKVGRRAFFNRFGLADNSTYFPPNATIFDTEAYANVFFNNNILMLPNTLQKIGPRCFMGCQNLKRVYLPSSLTSVGSNAFGLGTFDEQLDQFNDVYDEKRIDFYYQGTEAQYHALPLSTRRNIEADARSITFGVELHMHAATDYYNQFDCPYTQKYREGETL